MITTKSSDINSPKEYKAPRAVQRLADLSGILGGLIAGLAMIAALLVMFGWNPSTVFAHIFTNGYLWGSFGVIVIAGVIGFRWMHTRRNE